MTNGRAGGSRVRAVFLGSGGFGEPSLEVLARHPDVDLVGVVTASARSTPIAAAADALDVHAVLAPTRLRTPDSIAEILALRPDLLVLADYGQIVPGELLGLRHGALNLHPSLLPRHRGATPIPAAILAGDTETGVSLMRMDAGLDTGPIVAQRRMALRGDEMTPDLEAALGTESAHLLDETLGPWLRGELTAEPQPADGATLTRPLRREDGRIDPNLRAVDLWREVRAYQPWPGSFTQTTEGRLVVLQASVGETSDRPAGVFGSLGLAAVDRELLLHEVQPAGSRRMPWDAFVRGHPGIVGSSALASNA